MANLALKERSLIKQTDGTSHVGDVQYNSMHMGDKRIQGLEWKRAMISHKKKYNSWFCEYIMQNAKFEVQGPFHMISLTGLFAVIALSEAFSFSSSFLP